jgi:hypothetical protein
MIIIAKMDGLNKSVAHFVAVCGVITFQNNLLLIFDRYREFINELALSCLNEQSGYAIEL